MNDIIIYYISKFVLSVVDFVNAFRASNKSTYPVTAVNTTPGASVVASLVAVTTHEDKGYVEMSISDWEETMLGLDAAGRTLMALSLFLFCMRVFHFYAISRHLGPKVLMVGRMVRA